MKLKFLTILAVMLNITSFSQANESSNNISFYTGTFDVIDKEGDDPTSLFGVEHKNPELLEILFLENFLL